MCLAIPGKVIEINMEEELLMGKVDYSGLVSEICLAYCPDIKIGEYVLVHAGFAISKVDERSALETIEIYNQMIADSSKQN